MIIPSHRFWCSSGAYLPGHTYTWHIVDWDQRIWITVTGSEKALPDDDAAIKILSRHIDQLGPDLHKITVSDDGDIVSVSTNPKHNPTMFTHYPRYDPQDMPNPSCTTLTRPQMEEVDRIDRSIDLVRYDDGTGKIQLAVFKYALIYHHLPQMWNELQVMAALPRHELIVPVDRIVLDDIGHRVIGFTVPFISGGSFEDDSTLPFRFAWLQQLTSVVDDLNLKFGIVHQDIAGRNLAVDPVTEKIQLFDFELAAKIGSAEESPYRNDVDGVVFTVYEILTRDDHFRTIPHWDQDVKAVEDMAEWDVKIPIVAGDGGIKKIRSFLAEWAEGRRLKAKNGPVTASSQLDWPSYPPQTPIPYIKYPDSDDEDSIKGTIQTYMIRYAKDAMYTGQHVVRWERPPAKYLLTNNENQPPS
ncbi:hypothetical protein V496_05350 [Pseudogymnoascus sp. VKM F-4515 (FW-2607)]|nr:hypothetical protein V496_05350 [Pseudogymnoascus sp. VKM F-4515 (FW-2607)]KFY78760.1 hypothetical protein V498_09056 [Pseudogymnoascus sp. VKM F-4517 (FW-2822)]